MIMPIEKQSGFRWKNTVKITEGQLELYRVMKKRHDAGSSFSRQDLLDVYDVFVIPRKSSNYTRDALARTEEQVYEAASKWMNSAIARLVRTGYFGLQFKKPTEVLEMKEGVRCG